MLHLKLTDSESERIEEWPNGRKSADRTREKVREVGLDWEPIGSLTNRLLRQLSNSVIKELLLEWGLLFLMWELLRVLGMSV